MELNQEKVGFNTEKVGFYQQLLLFVHIYIYIYTYIYIYISAEMWVFQHQESWIEPTHNADLSGKED